MLTAVTPVQAIALEAEGEGVHRRSPSLESCGHFTVALDESELAACPGAATAVKRLASSLGGVTVLLKGRVDILSNGSAVWVSAVPSSPRRCGGIGDILSGSLGTFVSWAKSIRAHSTRARVGGGTSTQCAAEQSEATLMAALAASALARTAASMAFREHGRGMTAPAVLEKVRPAFRAIFE